MATEVILPALGMSQDTGKIVRWLKAEGEQVAKGEPLVEIETDKATVEIEAPASGLLARVVAAAGDEVPVGQVIALILAPGEASQEQAKRLPGRQPVAESAGQPKPRLSPVEAPPGSNGATPRDADSRPPVVAASLLASRIAAEHQVDLSRVKTVGPRVQKADVLAYLQGRNMPTPDPVGSGPVMASPKARRLAREQGKALEAIAGTGPGGAVLAADVLAALAPGATAPAEIVEPGEAMTVSTTWRIMAERTAHSWTSVPHFYLVREVNASRLIAWREHFLQQDAREVTYTDLLVKIVATSLRLHPRLNSMWSDGTITLMPEIHIGLAVAIEEGLVVPVIHQADQLGSARACSTARGTGGESASGQASPVGHQRRHVYHQQPGDVWDRCFQCHYQFAAGSNPGRWPHRPARCARQRSSSGAAYADAHAFLRPPGNRWRARRAIPGYRCRVDRGTPGIAG